MTIIRYQKGIDTQNAIINEAKRIFYEKGYKNTTISEICRNLNIHFGTLTYYFDTKLGLLKSIYGDLLGTCYAFVNEHSDSDIDILKKNTTASTMYFTAIFACPKTAKFHEHMLETESISSYISEKTGKIYRQFNTDYNLGLTNEEIEDYEQADLGARRERSLKFLSSRDDFVYSIEDIHNFTYMTNRIMGRIFSIDPDLIEQSIEFCKDFLKHNNNDKIKLF